MFDIVMPLFNKEVFVARTVQSVIAQSFTDWRLIIVDDGSSDGSVAVVERYRDTRISLLRQPNSGPGVARNTGIAAGTSDWIAFIDADDLWFPDHLQTLDDLRCRFPGAALIGSVFIGWDGGELVSPLRQEQYTMSSIRYFHEVANDRPPFFTSSAAFSRRAVEAVGPLKPVVVGDETELWARLALHGTVAATKKPTVLYRVGTGGITDSDVGADWVAAKSAKLENVSLPVATLIERLPHIEDHQLRNDIVDYVNFQVGVALMHALRIGRVHYARRMLELFPIGPRGKVRVAAMLAHLPAPFGQRLWLSVLTLKSAIRFLWRSIIS